MGRVCSMPGRQEEHMHGFGGNSEGKRPLERLTRKLGDNFKTYLGEI
jgi:hypothetical protein